jgi:hypothetical protein
MFCPFCGNQTDGNGKFCGRCGGDLSGSMAKAAGQTATSAVKAATGAGINAGAASAGGTVARAAVEATSSAVKAKLIYGAVLAAIVTGGILLYNIFFATGPIDVVHKFINAVNEKDINMAMECMDPTYERAYGAASNLAGEFLGVSLTDAADLLPAFMEFSGSPVDMQVREGAVIEEQASGDSAVIVMELIGEMTDENGATTEETGEQTFYLEKFEEGWRITDMP